ncbi:Ig-like domain-containing protein [Pseudomonas antarctica]|uniref:Ig-like domain-containing protein n=1 Tax=Pseudomonas antarctica TaxID=219572 RepID=UPI003F7569E2
MSSLHTNDDQLDAPTPFYEPRRLQAPFSTDTKPFYPENGEYACGINVTSPFRWRFVRWPECTKGDRYFLYFDESGDPVASDIVVDEDASAFYLTVPHPKDGLFWVFGRVVREGSLHESLSKPVPVLIKQSPPAGRDQEVTVKSHSGMLLTIDELAEGATITKDIASVGVTASLNKYQHARENDEITVTCAGVRTKKVLSAAEANGRGPFKIPIGPDVLKQIPSSGKVEFVAFLKDVANNIPEGEWPYSNIVTTKSENDINLLYEPTVLVDDEPSTFLDLLFISASLIQIQAILELKAPPSPQRNQVKFFIEFTKYGKSTTVPVGTVQDKNRRREVLTLEYDVLKDWADASGRVWFDWVGPTGLLLKRSASSFFRVSKELVSMPAVTLYGLLAGELASDKPTYAEMPSYTPMSRYLLETFWIVSKDGAQIHKELQQAGDQGGRYDISVETLKKFEGKEVDFYYTTDNSEGTSASLLTSKKVRARVGKQPAILKAPVVQGADENGYISENAIDRDLLFKLPFTDAREDDYCAWNVLGRNAVGSAKDEFTVKSALASPIFESILFAAPSNVRANNASNEISLSYAITRKSTGEIFRSEVAYVNFGQPPKIESVEVLEAEKWQNSILPKNVTKGATVVVTILGGLPTDLPHVQWQGAYNLSNAEEWAKWDPKTQKFYFTVDPIVVARGVRKGANKISIKVTLTRGRSTFNHPIQQYMLAELERRPPAVFLGGGATDTTLQLYALNDATTLQVDWWNLMSPNQNVSVELSGVFADGEPYKETLQRVVTDEDVTKRYVSFSVPQLNVSQLKDRSSLITATYVDLTESGDLNARLKFEEKKYYVEAIASTQAAPRFAGLTAEKVSINPKEYKDKASLSITVSGMRTAQTYAVKWMDPDNIPVLIPTKPGVTTGTLTFPVDNKLLAIAMGKTTPVVCDITTSGAQTIRSKPLELTVQYLDEKDRPQALINGVPGDDVLDLNKNPKLFWSLKPWTFMFAGQWLRVEALSSGVATQELFYGQVTAAQVTDGLVNMEVPSAFTANLRSDAKMNLHASVVMDGSNNFDRAMLLRPTSYTIKANLTVNTSALNLNGLSIRAGYAKTGLESINNTWQLVTSGGSGTVTWASSAPKVASVTSSGFVKGEGWGKATLTGTDAAGNKVTCLVNSSNVYNLHLNNGLATLPQHANFFNNLGRLIGFDGIADMQRQYGLALPWLDYHYWGGYYDAGRGYFWHFQNRGIFLGGENNHTFRAMGLIAVK